MMQRFTFNLLPEKPKEIVEKEIQRDNNSLMLAVLPLLSVIIAIGLLLVNALVVQKKVDEWEAAVSSRNTTITTFSSSAQRHIEFVQKAELLMDPIERDIEPERFFELSEKLLSKLTFPATVDKYGRQSDGSFDLTIIFSDPFYAGDVMFAFESLEEVSQPNTDTLTINSDTQQASMKINFFLNSLTDEIGDQLTADGR